VDTKTPNGRFFSTKAPTAKWVQARLESRLSLDPSSQCLAKLSNFTAVFHV